MLSRNGEFLLEPLHEADQLPNLHVGESVTVAVSHEADADGMFIPSCCSIAGHVGTWLLIQPSIAGKHDAVIEAVAD